MLNRSLRICITIISIFIYALTEQENMYYKYFYVYICTYRTREYVIQVFLCLYMYLQNKRICNTSISMFIYVLTEQENM